MASRLDKISSRLLSAFAGVAAFAFTLLAFILLSRLDHQLAASILIGLFALTIVFVAAERPNSAHARAVSALIERLLAVGSGDLASPAPAAVRREMPALASAVDALFEQVRSNLDDVHAIAMYDPVTSLPNRIHFKREAERMLKASPKGEGAALLFVDLDGFKAVNDRLGHAQGDQVLAMVAARLGEAVRSGCEPAALSYPLLARLAGDEFTLLLPALRGRQEAEAVAAQALAALAEPFRSAGHPIRLGASIGVALWPQHGPELPALMKAADIAMYKAKARGGLQVCVYDAELARVTEERARTAEALRLALARDEFELAFQPQVCARTGAVVAGEALIRWHQPGVGVRLPDSFIPVAERSSLILDIGEWVMDAAVDALGRWRTAGLRQRMTFNVSPRQLERPDFFARLRGALARTGSPPFLLELEFTESMIMQCDARILEELAAVRREGISIAIDDFGSGYSNIARLKDIPLDRVKLDRTLIDEVATSDEVRMIVSAVIHLVHGLGCEAVAEGVENRAQLDVLRAIGCDTIQGFSFAQPMPEEEFMTWVAAREQAEPSRRFAASVS